MTKGARGPLRPVSCGTQYRRVRFVVSRDWRLSCRLMAAARLRLRSWLGFSKYSCLRTSVSTPAFSQVRLKRRRATSNDSLSRIRTEGIQTTLCPVLRGELGPRFYGAGVVNAKTLD